MLVMSSHFQHIDLPFALISHPAVRFRDRNLPNGNVPKATQATAI
ncbi:hypothetical protein FVER14953_20987 [Fusarium verticillioides]|nr:hypothetical protein FVER14953_20987 [Fusarium verticillioides]